MLWQTLFYVVQSRCLQIEYHEDCQCSNGLRIKGKIWKGREYIYRQTDKHRLIRYFNQRVEQTIVERKRRRDLRGRHR